MPTGMEGTAIVAASLIAALSFVEVADAMIIWVRDESAKVGRLASV